MQQSQSSYLLDNVAEILVPPNTSIIPFTDEIKCKDLILLRNYLTEPELALYDGKVATIRRWTNFEEDKVVGIWPQHNLKYIGHTKGRYDVWNIADAQAQAEARADARIKRLVGNDLVRKSIGCLFLNKHTLTDGKWHKDTIDLFPTGTLANKDLPPFYWNLLIALTDQTLENGPTQFYVQGNEDEDENACIYWVPLKRGDAILFNGELTHRGTRNVTAISFISFTPKPGIKKKYFNFSLKPRRIGKGFGRFKLYIFRRRLN